MRISARTAPLVLIRVVLLVWQSTICRGPGPTGVKLNPDACYLAIAALSHPILQTGFHERTWPAPLRAAEQSFMYGSRLLGKVYLNNLTSFQENRTKKKQQHSPRKRERERAVRNQFLGLKGYFTYLSCKYRMLKAYM